MLKTVCVYCGSNFGSRPVYVQAARALAVALAERKIDLVYGGAGVGLMGALADAMLSAGGRVIGVMPQHMVDREIAHKGLTELHIVQSMHERKAMMADLADGFVALPGGLGTLEELFEVWTWGMLGLHQKPCGLLNTHGYYARLIEFLDASVKEGFVREQYRSILTVADDPRTLLDALVSYAPPRVVRWLNREGT